MTILAFAKGPTANSTLIALTILLKTMRFPTFTAFLNFINLKAKAKGFLVLFLLLILFKLKAIGIPAECLNNGLLMLCRVLKVATIMAITALITKQLFLKTLTVKFEAFWSFAVATHLFVTLHTHVLLLFVHGCKNVSFTATTTLGLTGGRITNRILNWKTLVVSLFKWFTKWLWI